jgi:hypothetical protein
MKKLTGGCCCGAVRFELVDDFSQFYFCHCEQCRRLTGSAHASNLFTRPDNIQWLQGQQDTHRYDHPERTFTQVFCKHCGSGLPFVTQSGQSLLVPAGSLDEEPKKQPDSQIFSEEQTHWHKVGVASKKIHGFP